MCTADVRERLEMAGGWEELKAACVRQGTFNKVLCISI